MTIVAIISLVLLGILLLLLEFFVVPGITIAGIGGVLFIGSGIYISYTNYGNTIGHYTVAGSAILILAVLIVALKSNTWNKLSLNAKVDSKLFSETKDYYKIGDTGKTISRLAPMGYVMINDQKVEARSIGSFIDQNTDIEVIAVESSKVIVKIKS